MTRRLAVTFGGFPDHCMTGQANVAGEFQASVKSKDGKKQVANEIYCAPGSARIQGTLPFTVSSGIHSGDDGILTATGPGAERFRGHLENTKVFRNIALALGLGR